MATMRSWNPVKDLIELQNELLRTFQRTVGWPAEEVNRVVEQTWGVEGVGGGFRPAIETFRRNGDLVVRAELPGVPEDQVEVLVRDGSLKIQGERPKPAAVGVEDYITREFPYGRFERDVRLPREARTGEITAAYENGVLEITVPKAADGVEAGRRVPIETRG
jgi:HSP20 family protein